MLKNKFKIIALLMLIILAISIPVVRAEDDPGVALISETEGQNVENDSTEEVHQENEEEESQQNATAQDSFKQGDVYLMGDEVVVDYIVDGNLFILANKVTINSQIGGDAFICAKSITVEEQGYIFSNLFAATQDLNIKGIVYDVYTVSDNITISGYIYRDMKASGTNVNILGAVGRNAFLNCSNLSFKNSETAESEENQESVASQGIINGNLEYSSSKEFDIPENAVSGETKFEKVMVSEASLADYIMELGTFVVTTLIIWLILSWIAPKFSKKTSTLLSKKILPVIGLGILTPIAFIVCSVILLMLGITSKIAAIAIILLILLLIICSSIFVIAINNLLCKKFNIEKKSITIGILVITSVALWLLKLIPIIGFIISFVSNILGLGIISSSFILKEKNKENA